MGKWNLLYPGVYGTVFIKSFIFCRNVLISICFTETIQKKYILIKQQVVKAVE